MRMASAGHAVFATTLIAAYVRTVPLLYRPPAPLRA